MVELPVPMEMQTHCVLERERDEKIMKSAAKKWRQKSRRKDDRERRPALPGVRIGVRRAAHSKSLCWDWTTTMVASHKRKNSNDATSTSSYVSRSIVFSPEKSRWEDTQAKMKSLRESLLTTHDPVLKELHETQQHESNMKDYMKEVKLDALDIQEKLDEKVQEAVAACQQESEQVYQSKVQLTELQAARDDLMEEMQDADNVILKLQNDIATYKCQAAEEIDTCETFEQEQKMRVPRLKHQISLYANCTGIKWDFEQERVLAGSMVRNLYHCHVILSSC